MSTQQDSDNNIDDTLETKDTDTKCSISDQRENEDIKTRLSTPLGTAIQSPITQEPQFLRPSSTGFSQKQTSDKFMFNGRITPPPTMISPLPATPAGSMTPVRKNTNYNKSILCIIQTDLR